MSMYGDTPKNELYETIESARDDYESHWQFVADLSSILAMYIEDRECYEKERHDG